MNSQRRRTWTFDGLHRSLLERVRRAKPTVEERRRVPSSRRLGPAVRLWPRVPPYLALLLALAAAASGCRTPQNPREREYSPLMRNYETARKECDLNGGNSVTKKTGCPTCVY